MLSETAAPPPTPTLLPTLLNFICTKPHRTDSVSQSAKLQILLKSLSCSSTMRPTRVSYPPSFRVLVMWRRKPTWFGTAGCVMKGQTDSNHLSSMGWVAIGVRWPSEESSYRYTFMQRSSNTIWTNKLRYWLWTLLIWGKSFLYWRTTLLGGEERKRRFIT